MVCAYDEMHRAMRRAGVDPRSVALDPYFDSGNPSAPPRLSYLQFVVGPPDCSDWSENIWTNPQTCLGPTWAARRNAILPLQSPMNATYSVRAARRRAQASVRDNVWGKYVKGEMTGSKFGVLTNRPLPERAVRSEVGADQ